jgi:hypothetical protein
MFIFTLAPIENSQPATLLDRRGSFGTMSEGIISFFAMSKKGYSFTDGYCNR